MPIPELLTVLCLAVVAYQDFRERAVIWFLFPALAILWSISHIQHSPIDVFLRSALLNVLLVASVLLLLWLYTVAVIGKRFLNTAFGLGDMLFLFAFALGFPTVTFIVLLASSLCFSLLAHFGLPSLREAGTVPLAGLMGCFMMAAIVLAQVPGFPSLYNF